MSDHNGNATTSRSSDGDVSGMIGQGSHSYPPRSRAALLVQGEDSGANLSSTNYYCLNKDCVWLAGQLLDRMDEDVR